MNDVNISNQMARLSLLSGFILLIENNEQFHWIMKFNEFA